MAYKKDIWDILSECKAPVIIIAANIVFYIHVHWIAHSPEYFQSLIFNEDNLLRFNFFSALTSGFIHFNFSHLFFNMLGVFVFGRIVERHMGWKKTLGIYLAALLFSMIFSLILYQVFFHQDLATIGSSGGVMGLLAAAMLLDPFAITYELIFPMPVIIKAWFYIFADIRGFLSFEPSQVNHLAHIMGFCSIGILIYFFSRKERQLMKEGLLVNVGTLVLFIILYVYTYVIRRGL